MVALLDVWTVELLADKMVDEMVVLLAVKMVEKWAGRMAVVLAE